MPAYPVEESTDMVFRLADKFLVSLSVISLCRIWQHRSATGMLKKTTKVYFTLSQYQYMFLFASTEKQWKRITSSLST